MSELFACILVAFVFFLHGNNCYVYHKQDITSGRSKNLKRIYGKGIIGRNTWEHPGRDVNFIINEIDMTNLEVMMIQRAMEQISKTTCINFISLNKIGITTCADFLPGTHIDDLYSLIPQPPFLCFVNNKLRNSTNCHFMRPIPSYVNNVMIYRKMSYIRLDATPNCFNMHTLLHEILHALGFEHEFQRPDRDDFVMFNESVINDTNYIKCNASECVYSYLYDHCSVMEYVFSHSEKNYRCPFKKIGLQNQLSYLDTVGINKKFNCSAIIYALSDSPDVSNMFETLFEFVPVMNGVIISTLCLNYAKIKTLFIDYALTSSSISWSFAIYSRIQLYIMKNHLLAVQESDSHCKVEVKKILIIIDLFATNLYCAWIFLLLVYKYCVHFEPGNFRQHGVLYLHKDAVEIQNLIPEHNSIQVFSNPPGFHVLTKMQWFFLRFAWIGYYGILMLFLAVVSSLTVFEVVNLGAMTLEFYLDPIGTLYWCEETRNILEFYYN